MTRRVLVTGSRNWRYRVVINDALNNQLNFDRSLTVIHGGAPGADTLADNWARGWIPVSEVSVEEYAADWEAWCDKCDVHRKHRRDGSSYCPIAGFLRNQKMVDLGADICLAFPLGRSHGTRDCMKRAKLAGIEVLDIGIA